MAFGVGKNQNKDYKSGDLGGSQITLAPARVLAVILSSDEYEEVFNTEGGYATLGGIKFEFTDNSINTVELDKALFALPYFSNHKTIPQKNEIVSIIALPNPGSSTSKIDFNYYYFPSVNTWNSPHVNAVPDEALSNQGVPTTLQKDYKDVETGSPRILTEKPTVLEFDNGFIERSTVRNIPYFPGDNVLEGSFGNHIRLGSTNSRTSLPNTWSSTGMNGDPIITIQNGQYPTDEKPWIPLSEDINLDDSSIYLTSTQKININTPVYLNNSYYEGGAPEDPKQFTQPQVILNSNRIGLFSRDSIIASSPKVHITGETVNMDMTGPFTVYASRVNLGSGNPEDLQPALKGDTTEKLLKDILEVLTALTKACSTATTGTVPIASLQKFAVENLAKVQALNTSTIKSDDTFIV